MEPRKKSQMPTGGFFGLALADIPVAADSVWAAWKRTAEVAWAQTARGALSYLVRKLRPAHLWLPAYICPELAAAVPSTIIRYYPVGMALSPDVSAIGSGIEPGDILLAVNYFGQAPSDEFIAFVRDRPDVHWIEDRSHTLWSRFDPWGVWQLYSARKLLGVPDGGLLVGPLAEWGLEPIHGRADVSHMLPELMRFEDEWEVDNESWYAAFRAREANITTEPIPGSRLARALLERIPIAPLVAARKRNYAVYAEKMRSMAALSIEPNETTPYGFPIRVEDSAALSARLAKERFFCTRHWALLPSDPSVFADEHRLSRQLLTLPCDHRYGVAQIERLIEAVMRLA